MANEDKKDFNAMLHDSKDMPKFQIITDVKSIEKYGGDRMYFAPPIDYDKVMRLVPFGKLLTIGTIEITSQRKMERISQNQLQQGYLYRSWHGRVIKEQIIKHLIGELLKRMAN